MTIYSVSGMSCAACQAKVEKAVLKVPGVTSCSVSLLTNSMGIEGTASSEAIIKAVVNAGYNASLKNNSNSSNSHDDSLKNTETPILIKRLIWSSIFLLLLMYISMGHVMWNWPLPAWFNGNHVAIGLLELILTIIILVINKKFFISGFKSLLHGAPNMDSLVALGSGVSFAYSLVMLFAVSDAVLKGNSEQAHNFMHNFYFESAAMIVTLITVGKLLESVSKGKTTNALKSLMKLSPKSATILKDNQEIEITVDSVVIGDIFIVRPGDSIPVDGIVLEGSSAVNESALTGESIPVEKITGSQVSAGTINTSGFLKCKATRVGTDTTISQIIQMVSDAAATKAPIAKIADKVSGIFVPTVISIAFITFIVWMISGAEFSFALSKSIAVLVVSCPCALGLATPVAIMVGNGVGAKNGILFKTSAALETTAKTQIIALDKTGTITKGIMQVVSIEEYKSNLLQIASSLENKSEHPLAKAIVSYAKEKNIESFDITNFEAISGKGIIGQINGTKYFGGNMDFIKHNCPYILQNNLETELLSKMETISVKGQTPLLFASSDEFLGIIAISDVIKEETPEAINQLTNMGIKVVMLTGDNEITAKAIAKEAGISDVIAGVLPDQKESVIKDLMSQGKVTMVGDGINDAPALTRANIGIAIGAGTDVAIDAADIVLVKSRLDDVPAAIRLSRKTLKNIHENLFWAFFYNIILIPIAAGVWYKLSGLQMNPMFGAAAMSLSSFCVVSNALRLNLAKIRNPKHDKKIKSNYKESNMEKTIKVEGMMCSHCEGRVKEALESIKGVESAVPNHEAGEVKLTLSKEIKDKDLEKAITKAGYKFLN